MYFASKALANAQKGYVAIELESLALAWAMEKSHHFLLASHFILETDQKQLEAILSKSLNQAAPKIIADTDQNIYIPLYSEIYTWY